MSKSPFTALKLNDWPERDRVLWQAAQGSVSVFDDDGLAARWRPATLRNCERGYGTFLGWLDAKGLLDPSQHPCWRVSLDRMKEFIGDFSPHRAPLTGAGTVRDIAMTLRAMSPTAEVTWLSKLGFRMVNKAKSVRPKLPRMASVNDVLDLGERLMAERLELLRQGKLAGAVRYRDGLVFTLLIYRPLRVRNFSSLRLGVSFLVDEAGMAIEFNADETKTGASIRQNVPSKVRPALEFYLAKVRPLLMRGEVASGWLWLGRRGHRMTEENFSVRVTRLSMKYLGRALSPHLFRDCAATHVALHSPEKIGITKSILAHATQASSQRFYNQATSFSAFSAYEAAIRRIREEGGK